MITVGVERKGAVVPERICLNTFKFSAGPVLTQLINTGFASTKKKTSD